MVNSKYIGTIILIGLMVTASLEAANLGPQEMLPLADGTVVASPANGQIDFIEQNVNIENQGENVDINKSKPPKRTNFPYSIDIEKANDTTSQQSRPKPAKPTQRVLVQEPGEAPKNVTIFTKRGKGAGAMNLANLPLLLASTLMASTVYSGIIRL